MKVVLFSREDTFQKKRAKNLIKIDKQWEKDLWTTKAESEKKIIINKLYKDKIKIEDLNKIWNVMESARDQVIK